MRVLRFFLPLLFLMATAAGEEFKANVDYIVLDPPQPVRVEKGKVEVREFFNFSCPHCFRLQSPLRRWLNGQEGDDIALRHNPVVFQRFEGHFARVYHTLEALQIADEFSPKIYQTIHRDRQITAVNNESRFLDWLEENGIDRAKAKAVYHSFSVTSKVNTSGVVASNYGVDGTPQMSVAGKYLVNPSISRSYERMVETVAWLVERERAALKE